MQSARSHNSLPKSFPAAVLSSGIHWERMATPDTPEQSLIQELIQRAASVVASVASPHGVVADVGAACIGENGAIYTGVCVGTDSNTICAERTAIATMIGANRTYLVRTIVAVWKDTDGAVYVIPPCGHCRQFIKDMHPNNIVVTQVILSHDVIVPLSDLLPYHDWWTKQPDHEG